jgi:Xaa-Pro aminopeptidase
MRCDYKGACVYGGWLEEQQIPSNLLESRWYGCFTQHHLGHWIWHTVHKHPKSGYIRVERVETGESVKIHEIPGLTRVLR